MPFKHQTHQNLGLWKRQSPKVPEEQASGVSKLGSKWIPVSCWLPFYNKEKRGGPKMETETPIWVPLLSLRLCRLLPPSAGTSSRSANGHWPMKSCYDKKTADRLGRSQMGLTNWFLSTENSVLLVQAGTRLLERPKIQKQKGNTYTNINKLKLAGTKQPLLCPFSGLCGEMPHPYSHMSKIGRCPTNIVVLLLSP